MTRSRRRLLSAALAALCALCWSASAASRAPHAPAFTVYASAEMAPECIRATMVAVEHLQTLGADLELVFVDETHPAFWAARDGEITVTSGVPEGIGRLAETRVVRTEDGDVARADVLVGLCNANVVAHSLSHIVGLENAVDHESLYHADGAE